MNGKRLQIVLILIAIILVTAMCALTYYLASNGMLSHLSHIGTMRL